MDIKTSIQVFKNTTDNEISVVASESLLGHYRFMIDHGQNYVELYFINCRHPHLVLDNHINKKFKQFSTGHLSSSDGIRETTFQKTISTDDLIREIKDYIKVNE